MTISKVVVFDGVQDSLATLQSTAREVEEPFSPEDVQAAIKKMSSHGILGMSGLRFRHLQDALSA